MEEPDADELVWMASEPFPDEDYEELYEERDDFDADANDDAQGRPSHPAPEDYLRRSSVEETGRKRFISDVNGGSFIDQVQTTAKRVRSLHNVLSPQKEAPTHPSSPDLLAHANVDGSTGKTDAILSCPSEAVETEKNFPSRMASSIDGEFVTVTGPSGDRVYAKFDRTFSFDLKSRDRTLVSTKGLLAQPIEEMFERAEEERTRKMFADNPIGDLADVMAPQSGGKHEQLWVEKYAPKSFTDLLSDEQTNRQVLRWLKQWDPCVFGNVPDSSTTSKEVLDTLRLKKVSTEGKIPKRAFRQDPFGGRKWTRDGPPKNRSDSWASKGGTAFEVFGSRPVDEIHEKVLLLCGPPGLGKTTLAHIAAKHCGYRIVEINASDDRVASTLQAKILDAVQMKSVTGDSRPNCLIIDEIDGAVGGTEGRSAIKQLVDIAVAEQSFKRLGSKSQALNPERCQHQRAKQCFFARRFLLILNLGRRMRLLHAELRTEFLLDAITATNKKNKGSEENQAQDSTKGITKKKKTAAIRSLSRPIICICNDLYAPALRPLRQIARVHMFSRPTASRVVTRLKYICTEEGFQTNIRALTMLAEHAESDIRACLNTLQFLKRKGQPLTTVDIGSQIIGSKDMTKSVYDIWGEIFRKLDNPLKPKTHEPKGAVSKLAHEQLQFLRIYDLISNYGDHDLAIDGIHENLLQTGYQDSSLSKTVECLHSMGDSDIRTKEVYSKQRYFVNGYQPSTLVTIRSLIAVPVRPNIQWPRAFQRHKTEVAAKKEMLNTWFNQISPAISRSISMTPLTLDLLSPLLAILCPPLRPVAVQLYTSFEKQTMKQLVDTMVSFGLTYKPGKGEALTADGRESSWPIQGGVFLEPALSTMVTFEGYKTQHRQLSTTICLLLAHEVELERIRRESIAAIKAGESTIEGPFSAGNKSTTSENVKGRAPLSGLFNSEHKHREFETKLLKDVPRNGDLHASVPTSVTDVPAEKKDSVSTLPSSKVKRFPTVAHQATNVFDGWKKRGAQGGNEKNASVLVPNQRDLRPLLYKFHEGFTNAIRRPMLVKEFL